jgi:hypothetical protein
MALEFILQLKGISTRNLPEGKEEPVHDNLAAIRDLTVLTMWNPRHLTTVCATTA